MNRLFVIGSRGMLGQMVVRHFAGLAGWQVETIDEHFDLANLNGFFDRFDALAPAIFVNGVGAIPQKVRDDQAFVLANLLLPLELERGLHPKHRLVQPSTDCVFRGDRGTPYPADAPADAADVYGWTKALAERALLRRPNTLVVRTSIIGPSANAGAGLLQWFLSQPVGARVSGYVNHRWNGLTTLQWCKEVESLLADPPDPGARLVQIASTGAHSKHEMLCLFRDVFRPDIEVVPVEHAQAVDRRLEAGRAAPALAQQLRELARRMEAVR
jgi:dTDP-4-dehydrorhamnose reductase